MKSILLHVHEDDGLTSRFLAACDIARATGAHLTCVQVTPLSTYVASDPFGGFYPVAGLFEHLEERSRVVRERLDKRLVGGTISWDWQEYDGDVAQTLVTRSRLADLVVLSQSSDAARSSSSPLALAADVAIHARAPVLSVPTQAGGMDPRGAAMVAWNGSAESANALRLAVPLLRIASSVNIVTIVEDGSITPTDDASLYLERHGITSQVSERPLAEMTVGRALDAAAVAMEAAYMVIGAYGHSRFREALLGGVTRQMIAESSVPLVLAH